jgi:nicotinate-nucleotide adenylyltransferase
VKIGLFGGTFDPPHIGHLVVAQDAALALGLDRILFVPAARPPHKDAGVEATPAQRARMVELAIGDDARFGLDPIELERNGPSYSVDTLRALRVRDPDAEWTLLVGMDQYEEFATWREPDAIRRLARLAVLTRPGVGGEAAAGSGSGTAVAPVTRLPDGAVRVAVTRIELSSTTVRERVAAGMPIRYMVPAAVERFIYEAGLYVRNGAPVTG